jgi:hypothetical protein
MYEDLRFHEPGLAWTVIRVRTDLQQVQGRMESREWVDANFANLREWGGKNSSGILRRSRWVDPNAVDQNIRIPNGDVALSSSLGPPRLCIPVRRA